jgi:flagellin
MRINTNVSAMTIARQGLSINRSLDQALERLSTGSRINRAGDDASGLAISEQMRARIRTYDAGSRNLQEGIAALGALDSALAELTDLAQRGLELASAYGAGLASTEAQNALTAEGEQILATITSIAAGVNFNGFDLSGLDSIEFLDGLSGTAGTKVSYTVPNLSSADGTIDSKSSLGSAVSPPTDVTTASTFTDYIDQLTEARATLGGAMASMQSRLNVIAGQKEAVSAANSLIRDTDVAAESTALTRAQILAQSNVAMLAQANALPQQVLKLLQG